MVVKLQSRVPSEMIRETRQMLRIALLCLTFAFTFAAAQAQDPSDRLLRSRAVEAALWRMPAVSMAASRRSLPGMGADYNQIFYFSNPLEARHEFITANNNTPYVVVVLDLHSGPIVMEVPTASNKIALFGSAI